MKKSIIISLVALTFFIGTGLASAASVMNLDGDLDFYGHFTGEGDLLIETNRDNSFTHFESHGSFTGEYWMDSVDHNQFDTDVLFNSNSPAEFSFYGKMNFVTSYTDEKAYAIAHAEGETSALMNLKFDNSMYIAQLERHDTNQDFLSGAGNYDLYWEAGVLNADDSVKTYGYCGIAGDDTAFFDTNQWHRTADISYGWGSPNSWEAPTLPGYYYPTNSVGATGMGLFTQSAFGGNNLVFNGFSGAGSALYTHSFTSGFSGTPTMNGN